MSLTINDLSCNSALDQAAMTALRGGDNGNAVANTIGQLAAISVPVVVGTAGPANTSVHVNGTQTTNVLTNQFAGDSFFALLGL